MAKLLKKVQVKGWDRDVLRALLVARRAIQGNFSLPFPLADDSPFLL
jgi:hypothetical protein